MAGLSVTPCAADEVVAAGSAVPLEETKQSLLHVLAREVLEVPRDG